MSEIRNSKPEKMNPLELLFESMHHTLEIYSNVHRGSGHKSMVTTHLYEKARKIVLDYLDKKNGKYTVIFCTARRAHLLSRQIPQGKIQRLSSAGFGLPLGVTVLVLNKSDLPKGIPFQTGGGTTRLYSKEWVLWANEPDRFEAGTPAIVNVIAFARALLLMKEFGQDVFQKTKSQSLPLEEILHHDELNGFSGNDLLEKLRQTQIGRKIQVPTTNGTKSFINFDNSASTPTFKPVWKAFKDTFIQPEEIRKQIIQEVRKICAETLGAPQDEYEIVFTSNTTEAINLVAENLATETNEGVEPVIVNTMLEHSSNDLPWRNVQGHTVIKLNVSNEGFWDLKELENLLEAYNNKHLHGRKRINLVAVSGASNVLGTCNDLGALSLLVHRYGAKLLVDAAQLVAHREINVNRIEADYLAFSAHKVYAPFGCGVLVARKGIMDMNSEKMKLAISSGEENAGGIAALGKSLLLLKRIGFGVIHHAEESLTQRAIEGMKKIEGLRILGVKETDSAKFGQKIGVIVFDIKNMMGGKIAKKLALNQGIGIRFGCHCAHLIVKQLSGFTPFLERLQKTIIIVFPKLTLQGFARISFGLENTSEEVDVLLIELERIARRGKSSGNININEQTSSAQMQNKADVKKMMTEFIASWEQKIYSRIN